MTTWNIKAGEYWQSVNQPDLRCQIVGVANNGTILMQFSDDGSDCDEIPSFLRAWRHLPDCTGWDWEPPAPITTCPDCGEFCGHGHEDVCPMAWVTQDRVLPRAGIDQVKWSDWSDKSYLVSRGGSLMHGQTTAGVSASLCVRCRRKDLPPVPEPVPAESPDDWVTQDRVDPRPGLDQFAWTLFSGNLSPWINVERWHRFPGMRHGSIDSSDGQMLHVRCLRKDLPPMPEPVKTIDVDPGDGYRWLENSETVTPTDEIFRPDREPMWVQVCRVATGAPYMTAGYYGWDVRRAICRTTPSPEPTVDVPQLDRPEGPLQPKRTIVRLWAPWRVNESGSDWPVRVSQSEIMDVATWVEIKHDGTQHDGTQFYVEEP